MFPKIRSSPQTTASSMRNVTPSAPTLAVTSSSRGKYTFLMRLALPTSVSIAVLTVLAKKFQGTSAQSRKITKLWRPLGSPTGGSILRKVPKTTV